MLKSCLKHLFCSPAYGAVDFDKSRLANVYFSPWYIFVGKTIGTAYRRHWQKVLSMTFMVTFAGACTISPSILCINHSEVTMWTLWWAWHLLVSPSWMPVSDRSPLKCRSRPLSRAWACWNIAKAIRRRPWNRQGARASWGNHDFLCKICEYMLLSGGAIHEDYNSPLSEKKHVFLSGEVHQDLWCFASLLLPCYELSRIWYMFICPHMLHTCAVIMMVVQSE